jgi:hypothetical protein
MSSLVCITFPASFVYDLTRTILDCLTQLLSVNASDFCAAFSLDCVHFLVNVIEHRFIMTALF